MARIRTIKPDFWTSEQVMDCKPLTRLLFIGLWNFVDDYGRSPVAPRTIRARIFPGDDISGADVQDMLNELNSRGLILFYSADDKEYFEITGWAKHQKIDNPSKNNLCPAPFAEGSQILARTSEEKPKFALEGKGRDRKVEEKNSRSVADATRPIASAFDEFWKAYPRRDGPNPRKPAETKFNALAKTGVDPEMMIAAVKRMAAEQSKDIGTRFIPQAITWLNQQRWADHAVEAFTAEQPVAGFYVKFGSPEQDAWDAYRKAREGKPYPRDGKGGWHHPSQWPPGHEEVEVARSEPPVLRMQSI